MKKRILSLMLVMALMVSVFAGCSQNTADNDAAQEADTPAAEQVAAVDVKKVFVTPQWVKSVIDGEQPESANYVIAETSWGDSSGQP